jgi:hypothetical protein
MNASTILLGNLIFLTIVLLIFLLVGARNGHKKPAKKQPRKVKEDIAKIKEQIEGD